MVGGRGGEWEGSFEPTAPSMSPSSAGSRDVIQAGVRVNNSRGHVGIESGTRMACWHFFLTRFEIFFSTASS